VLCCFLFNLVSLFYKEIQADFISVCLTLMSSNFWTNYVSFFSWSMSSRDHPHFCIFLFPAISNTVMIEGCDCRWGLDWWMDLLTTCTHHSELQVITALSLISTLYKSLAHAKSSQSSLDDSGQWLLTVKILQLPALRSSCHSHSSRTQLTQL
jgi:hypothetical protein